jgi:hypothetical protein
MTGFQKLRQYQLGERRREMRRTSPIQGEGGKVRNSAQSRHCLGDQRIQKIAP